MLTRCGFDVKFGNNAERFDVNHMSIRKFSPTKLLFVLCFVCLGTPNTQAAVDPVQLLTTVKTALVGTPGLIEGSVVCPAKLVQPLFSTMLAQAKLQVDTQSQALLAQLTTSDIYVSYMQPLIGQYVDQGVAAGQSALDNGTAQVAQQGQALINTLLPCVNLPGDIITAQAYIDRLVTPTATGFILNFDAVTASLRGATITVSSAPMSISFNVPNTREFKASEIHSDFSKIDKIFDVDGFNFSVLFQDDTTDPTAVRKKGIQIKTTFHSTDDDINEYLNLWNLSKLDAQINIPFPTTTTGAAPVALADAAPAATDTATDASEASPTETTTTTAADAEEVAASTTNSTSTIAQYISFTNPNKPAAGYCLGPVVRKVVSKIGIQDALNAKNLQFISNGIDQLLPLTDTICLNTKVGMDFDSKGNPIVTLTSSLGNKNLYASIAPDLTIDTSTTIPTITINKVDFTVAADIDGPMFSASQSAPGMLGTLAKFITINDGMISFTTLPSAQITFPADLSVDANAQATTVTIDNGFSIKGAVATVSGATLASPPDPKEQTFKLVSDLLAALSLNSLDLDLNIPLNIKSVADIRHSLKPTVAGRYCLTPVIDLLLNNAGTIQQAANTLTSGKTAGIPPLDAAKFKSIAQPLLNKLNNVCIGTDVGLGFTPLGKPFFSLSGKYPVGNVTTKVELQLALGNVQPLVAVTTSTTPAGTESTEATTAEAATTETPAETEGAEAGSAESEASTPTPVATATPTPAVSEEAESTAADETEAAAAEEIDTTVSDESDAATADETGTEADLAALPGATINPWSPAIAFGIEIEQLNLSDIIPGAPNIGSFSNISMVVTNAGQDSGSIDGSLPTIGNDAPATGGVLQLVLSAQVNFQQDMLKKLLGSSAKISLTLPRTARSLSDVQVKFTRTDAVSQVCLFNDATHPGGLFDPGTNATLASKIGNPCFSDLDARVVNGQFELSARIWVNGKSVRATFITQSVAVADPTEALATAPADAGTDTAATAGATTAAAAPATSRDFILYIDGTGIELKASDFLGDNLSNITDKLPDIDDLRLAFSKASGPVTTTVLVKDSTGANVPTAVTILPGVTIWGALDLKSSLAAIPDPVGPLLNNIVPASIPFEYNINPTFKGATLQANGGWQLPSGLIKFANGGWQLPSGIIQMPSGISFPAGSINVLGNIFKLPNGNLSFPGGALRMPNGSINFPGIGIKMPNIKGVFPDISMPGGFTITADGRIKFPNGSFKLPDMKGNFPQISFGDGSMWLPNGSIRLPGGSIHWPDINGNFPELFFGLGAIRLPDGSIKLPDGTIKFPDINGFFAEIAFGLGAIRLPDGSIKLPDGTIHLPDLNGNFPDISLGAGAIRFLNGNIQLPDGTIKFPTFQNFAAINWSFAVSGFQALGRLPSLNPKIPKLTGSFPGWDGLGALQAIKLPNGSLQLPSGLISWPACGLNLPGLSSITNAASSAVAGVTATANSVGGPVGTAISQALSSFSIPPVNVKGPIDITGALASLPIDDAIKTKFPIKSISDIILDFSDSQITISGSATFTNDTTATVYFKSYKVDTQPSSVDPTTGTAPSSVVVTDASGQQCAPQIPGRKFVLFVEGTNLTVGGSDLGLSPSVSKYIPTLSNPRVAFSNMPGTTTFDLQEPGKDSVSSITVSEGFTLRTQVSLDAQPLKDLIGVKSDLSLTIGPKPAISASTTASAGSATSTAATARKMMLSFGRMPDAPPACLNTFFPSLQDSGNPLKDKLGSMCLTDVDARVRNGELEISAQISLPSKEKVRATFISQDAPVDPNAVPATPTTGTAAAPTRDYVVYIDGTGVSLDGAMFSDKLQGISAQLPSIDDPRIAFSKSPGVVNTTIITNAADGSEVDTPVAIQQGITIWGKLNIQNSISLLPEPVPTIARKVGIKNIPFEYNFNPSLSGATFDPTIGAWKLSTGDFRFPSGATWSNGAITLPGFSFPTGTKNIMGNIFRLPSGDFSFLGGAVRKFDGSITFPNIGNIKPDALTGLFPEISFPNLPSSPGGKFKFPDGSIRVPIPTDLFPITLLPDGSIKFPDGTIKIPDITGAFPRMSFGDGSTWFPNGSIELPDGSIHWPDLNGNFPTITAAIAAGKFPNLKAGFNFAALAWSGAASGSFAFHTFPSMSGRSIPKLNNIFPGYSGSLAGLIPDVSGKFKLPSGKFIWPACGLSSLLPGSSTPSSNGSTFSIPPITVSKVNLGDVLSNIPNISPTIIEKFQNTTLNNFDIDLTGGQVTVAGSITYNGKTATAYFHAIPSLDSTATAATPTPAAQNCTPQAPGKKDFVLFLQGENLEFNPGDYIANIGDGVKSFIPTIEDVSLAFSNISGSTSFDISKADGTTETITVTEGFNVKAEFQFLDTAPQILKDLGLNDLILELGIAGSSSLPDATPVAEAAQDPNTPPAEPAPTPSKTRFSIRPKNPATQYCLGSIIKDLMPGNLQSTVQPLYNSLKDACITGNISLGSVGSNNQSAVFSFEGEYQGYKLAFQASKGNMVRTLATDVGQEDPTKYAYTMGVQAGAGSSLVNDIKNFFSSNLGASPNLNSISAIITNAGLDNNLGISGSLFGVKAPEKAGIPQAEISITGTIGSVLTTGTFTIPSTISSIKDITFVETFGNGQYCLRDFVTADSAVMNRLGSLCVSDAKIEVQGDTKVLSGTLKFSDSLTMNVAGAITPTAKVMMVSSQGTLAVDEIFDTSNTMAQTVLSFIPEFTDLSFTLATAPFNGTINNTAVNLLQGFNLSSTIAFDKKGPVGNMLNSMGIASSLVTITVPANISASPAGFSFSLSENINRNATGRFRFTRAGISVSLTSDYLPAISGNLDGLLQLRDGDPTVDFRVSSTIRTTGEAEFSGGFTGPLKRPFGMGLEIDYLLVDLGFGPETGLTRVGFGGEIWFGEAPNQFGFKLDAVVDDSNGDVAFDGYSLVKDLTTGKALANDDAKLCLTDIITIGEAVVPGNPSSLPKLGRALCPFQHSLISFADKSGMTIGNGPGKVTIPLGFYFNLELNPDFFKEITGESFNGGATASIGLGGTELSDDPPGITIKGYLDPITIANGLITISKAKDAQPFTGTWEGQPKQFEGATIYIALTMKEQVFKISGQATAQIGPLQLANSVIYLSLSKDGFQAEMGGGFAGLDAYVALDLPFTPTGPWSASVWMDKLQVGPNGANVTLSAATPVTRIFFDQPKTFDGPNLNLTIGPNDFSMSGSAKLAATIAGQEIAEVDTSIEVTKQKFRFDAQMKLFLFDVFLDIESDYTGEAALIVSAGMNPLDIGGVLLVSGDTQAHPNGVTIRRKGQDMQFFGPVLTLTIGSSPSFTFSGQASAKLGGLTLAEVGVSAEVNKNGYEFDLNADLFDVFKPQLQVKQSFKDGSFEILGYMDAFTFGPFQVDVATPIQATLNGVPHTFTGPMIDLKAARNNFDLKISARAGLVIAGTTLDSVSLDLEMTDTFLKFVLSQKILILTTSVDASIFYHSMDDSTVIFEAQSDLNDQMVAEIKATLEEKKAEANAAFASAQNSIGAAEAQCTATVDAAVDNCKSGALAEEAACRKKMDDARKSCVAGEQAAYNSCLSTKQKCQDDVNASYNKCEDGCPPDHPWYKYIPYKVCDGVCTDIVKGAGGAGCSGIIGAGCEALNDIGGLACATTKFISQVGCDDIIGKVGTAACDTLKLGEIGCDTLEVAKGAVAAAQAVTDGTLDLANQIVAGVADNFNLKDAKFTSKVGCIKQGDLGTLNLDIILFKHEFTPTFDLNFAHFGDLIKSAIKSQVDSLMSSLAGSNQSASDKAVADSNNAFTANNNSVQASQNDQKSITIESYAQAKADYFNVIQTSSLDAIKAAEAVGITGDTPFQDDPYANWTPLMYFAKKGMTDAVTYLLSDAVTGGHYAIDPNAINGNGMTALMIAVQERQFPVIDILLADSRVKSGINLQRTTGDHATALTLALQNPPPPTDLSMLPPFFQRFMQSALAFSGSFVQQQSDLMTKLLNNGALLHADVKVSDPPVVSRSILSLAAQDYPQYVDTLLANSGTQVATEIDEADLNGMTPLGYATWYGNYDAAISLINAGADVNKADTPYTNTSGDPVSWTPLMQAAYLLAGQHTADPNDPNSPVATVDSADINAHGETINDGLLDCNRITAQNAIKAKFSSTLALASDSTCTASSSSSSAPATVALFEKLNTALASYKTFYDSMQSQLTKNNADLLTYMSTQQPFIDQQAYLAGNCRGVNVWNVQDPILQGVMQSKCAAVDSFRASQAALLPDNGPAVGPLADLINVTKKFIDSGVKEPALTKLNTMAAVWAKATNKPKGTDYGWPTAIFDQGDLDALNAQVDADIADSTISLASLYQTYLSDLSRTTDATPFGGKTAENFLTGDPHVVALANAILADFNTLSSADFTAKHMKVLQALLSVKKNVKVRLQPDQFGQFAYMLDLLHTNKLLNPEGDSLGYLVIHNLSQTASTDYQTQLSAELLNIALRKQDNVRNIDAMTPSTRRYALALIQAGADITAVTDDGRTVLIAVIKVNDLNMINALIARNVDINKPGTGDFAMPPVQIAWNESIEDNGAALNANSKQILLAMINAQADPNIMNADGQTLLINAILNNDTNLVNAVLSSPRLDPNKTGTGTYNESPVWYAYRSGNTDWFNRLVDKGADVNQRDNSGWTLLTAAIRDKNTAVATKLIGTASTQLAYKNPSGVSPGWMAYAAAEYDILTLLLNKNLDIDNDKSADDLTLLMAAARDGNLSVVNQIIGLQKATLSLKLSNKMSAVWYAYNNKHFDIVNALLGKATDAYKVNVDTDTYIDRMNNNLTLLMAAAKDSNQNLIQQIISLNTANRALSFPSQKRTAMWYAYEAKNYNGVSALLTAGANVDTELSEDGLTVLMAAARDDVTTILSQIIAANKATLSLKTPLWNKSAVWFAYESKHYDAVNTLLDAGVSVDTDTSSSKTDTTPSKLTLLMASARDSNIDLARYIITAKKVTLSQKDQSGKSALWYTYDGIKKGYNATSRTYGYDPSKMSIVILLITNGIDVNVDTAVSIPDNGIDVNTDLSPASKTLFMQSVNDQIDGVLKMALKTGKISDEEVTAAYNLAMARGFNSIVRELTDYLPALASLNKQDTQTACGFGINSNNANCTQ